MTTFTRLLACVLLLGLGTAAEAQLVPRQAGVFVYDVDRDITWTADANLAETIGWIGVGAGPKFVADLFIIHLNTIGFGGVSDWRLPTGDLFCSPGPLNCTDAEMGHLFYDELSGTAGTPISTSGDPNLASRTCVPACGCRNLEPLARDLAREGTLTHPTTRLVGQEDRLALSPGARI